MREPRPQKIISITLMLNFRHQSEQDVRPERADALDGIFGSVAHLLNFIGLTFLRGFQKPKSELGAAPVGL